LSLMLWMLLSFELKLITGKMRKEKERGREGIWAESLWARKKKQRSFIL
jgi:hypothetical protein